MRGGLDAQALASLLRACRSLDEGRCLRAQIAASAYAGDRYLSNLLVQMYGACGSLDDALDVFSNAMPSRNLYSWSILLAACSLNDAPDAATAVLHKMPQHNAVAATTALTAMAQHGRLLIDAASLFHAMPHRTAVTWTTMVAGYGRHGDADGAAATFARSPEWDACAWAAIVSAFAQSGRLQEAKSVFDAAAERTCIAWNTLLAGYAQSGDSQAARQTFHRMPHWSLVSWNVSVSAYAQAGEIQLAAATFDSMPHRDVISWNTIIAAHGSGGDLSQARRMFDNHPDKNSVSWNSMLAAYADNGRFHDAVGLFQDMDLEGFRPTKVTLVSALEACAAAGASAIGAAIANDIADTDVESIDAAVACSLLNMYGRCGLLVQAKRVFDAMAAAGCLDCAVWSSMIASVARSGHSSAALSLFREMGHQGVAPDSITFITIISACSHSGLLNDGRTYFSFMVDDYGLKPSFEHYKCVADLLGRAGMLELAEELLQTACPFVPDASAWLSLLSACKSHGETGSAANAAGQASVVGHDRLCSQYVLLVNLCTQQ